MASTLIVSHGDNQIQLKSLTPNMTLVTVVEKVCTELKLEAPTKYALAHKGKELDSSLTIRFANLPNMTKLELVTRARSPARGRGPAAMVNVLLQTETGARLQASFPPSSSLWNILTYWDAEGVRQREGGSGSGEASGLTFSYKVGPKEPETPVKKSIFKRKTSNAGPAVVWEPSINFMNKAYTGAPMLKSTQLSTLGLTDGSALLRLRHMPTETLADPVSPPSSPPSASAPSGVVSPTAAADSIRATTTSTNPNNFQEAPTPPSLASAPGAGARPVAPVSPRGAKDKAERHHRGRDRRAGKASTNASSSSSNPSSPAATPGSSGSSGHGKPALPPPPMVPPPPAESSKAGKSTATPMDTSGSSPVKSTGSTSSSAPRDGPPPPPDRGMTVWAPPRESGGQNMNRFDVDPSFYETSVEDAKFLQSSQVKKAGSGEMLMTKAMRERAAAPVRKYQRCLIRIRFPDRLQIEGIFTPREPVSSLFTFVRGTLSDPRLEFYLYTTPPVEHLKDDTGTMESRGLVPNCVVHFVTKEHYDLQRSSGQRPSLSAPPVVKGSILAQMRDLPESDPGESAKPTKTTDKDAGSKSGIFKRLSIGGSGRGSDSFANNGDGKGKKIPRWLKLGKK